MSGVGVQLFHQHDKWFRETPSLFTDQSQTHQNAVNEHFPPSGLHLPAPVVLALRAGDAGGGWQNGEMLGIGVERQPGLGLGCLSVCGD